MSLRMIAPFLHSTSALSLVCRGRDLVNSTRSFSSSLATSWLTYSEPQSEWNPRMAKGKPSSSKAIAGTQIIEVRHRDRGQSGIARIAEALVGPDEQRLGGRTRKRVVQAVEFSEQRHVLGAILACIAGAAGPTARAKRLRLSIAGQQARQMLPRIARQPLQVSEEHPALLLG